MNFYRNDRAITLHFILEENQDNRKAVFVNVDGDGNEFNNDNMELDFEGCSNGDYFGCHILEQVSNSTRSVQNDVFGQYEHPLQICIVSIENHEGITGSNPTPEKIVHEDELERGDKVTEEMNEVREGSEEVHEEGHIIPYQDANIFEEDVTGFDSQVSPRSRRHNGSDLMVGEHFSSKTELNYKLSLIAINGKFEMKTKKNQPNH
ncbi:hypothetical protein TorRG33x02_197680 [Trema orientale]|uniref:Uncharacterized protein n=1 Tax=Trema orientale TaxID=63057 RepID=A0A2P5EFW4_TREOI|nr:hypothetical protein TorRG33x02_197680 [Trema orientale]